jgi:alkaline phosphatase
MKVRLKKIFFASFVCFTLVLLLNSPFITASKMSNNDRVPVTDDFSNLSIILMIGDGMGYNHIELANLVEYGTTDNLTMEKLPYLISIRTNNVENKITDSAAAVTAIATGYKTYNGYIDVDINGDNLTNILEIAQSMNKSTGVIATSAVNHATPAGFMSHTSSRYADAEIISQIIESKVDVILGGGTSYFSVDQINTMLSYGYNISYTRDQLLSTNSSKILGLFASVHLPEEEYRNITLVPSLAEMTIKALDVLSKNENGFFMMVEGSQIDWGAHDNDKVYVALETIAFDYAVQVAYDYVQTHENTILIVTADHETGGLQIISNNLDNTLPIQLGTEEQKREQRIVRANEITVSWSSTDHTAAYVPLYAYGTPFDDLENGILIENTDIFNMMNQSFHDLPISITDISPTPTTTPEKTAFSTVSWLLTLFIIPYIFSIRKRKV